MATVIYYGNAAQTRFEVPGSATKVVYVAGVLTAPASSDFQSVTLAVAPGVMVPVYIEFFQAALPVSAGSVAAQDEGVNLAGAAETFNFVGAGVAVTGTGGVKTVTIPGGGAGAVQNALTPASSTVAPSVDAVVSAIRTDAAFLNADAMAALVINTTKAMNTKSIVAASTFTFSAAPAQANSLFALRLTNGGATDLAVTIPSSRSAAQQAVITSFVLPANAIAWLLWEYDGVVYHLTGEPIREKFSITWNLEGTTAAKTYRIAQKLGVGLVVTEVASIADSGSGLATVKIDTVALGGTANTVSAVEQAQAHATANVASIGTDLSVTTAAGLVNPSVTVSGYKL